MARDYKAEYQKAKENGWLPKAERWTLTLTGNYPDRFRALLELWECKTLGEFIRAILDGRIILKWR